MARSIGSIRSFALRHKLGLAIAGLGAATIALAYLPLKDSAATLLGSFLGAFVAVAAASWAGTREQRGRNRENAAAIRLIVEPCIRDIEELLDDMLVTPAMRERGRFITEHRLTLALGMVADARSDIDKLFQHLGSFGAVNITSILATQRALEVLQDDLDDNVRYFSDPNSDLSVRDGTIMRSGLMQLKRATRWVYEV